MKYRREIDGLRALAIIPVVLYHAGFAAISGGFIGVDVFFVISGFLITGIIYSDLENNDFILKSFMSDEREEFYQRCFLWLLCVPYLLGCIFQGPI